MSGFIHGEEAWPCNPGNLMVAPLPFGDACNDCAVEAWERMTTGGVGFHAKRMCITYSYDGVYCVSQTKYVHEGAVVTR